MHHPEAARETGDRRLGFGRRLRLECRGTQLSSDGDFLVMRKLDDTLFIVLILFVTFRKLI